MSRNILILVILIGLGSWVATFTHAQSITIPASALGPTTKPQPTAQPAAPSGSLPAGHPDISQMTPPPNSVGAAGVSSAMPEGVNLPAGHPDISQFTQNATTQPGAMMGSLTIRTAQSSAGGPAISAEPYAVELYIQGQLFNKLEGKLDEKGAAVVEGIPLRFNLQPVIKVMHAGAEYSAAAPPMNGSTNGQEVPVAVYETTDKQPDWTVRMRHVMVERVEGGLHVMEMLAIDNPSDRAWLGNPSSDGRRATFSINLPAGAQGVQVLDEQASSATIDGSKLTNTMALVPGTTQFRFVYHLPVNEGKALITATAPALVRNMMVFVPDDGTTVKAQGLEAMGSSDMGEGKQRFYRGSELAAGQEVTIAISGIVDVTRTVGASGGSTHAAQIVAGVGAVVILLFGVAFVLLRGPRTEARGANSPAKR